jgi:hypothetical protein
MTSKQDFLSVGQVYDHFEEPLPAVIVKAGEVLRAATVARTAVNAEAEPVIDVSSVKAVIASVDKIALHRATAEHRRAVAAAVEQAAMSAELDAWHQNVTLFHTNMKAWYGSTVKKFLDVLDRLDGSTDIGVNVGRGRGDIHAHAETLAADLSMIRRARNVLHGRLDAEFTPFWKWTQIVAVPDKSTTMRLDAAVKGKRFEPDPGEGGLTWWAQLSKVEGVTLEYHDPHEQAALYRTLPTRAPGTSDFA